MHSVRIIPRLDIKGSNVIKGVHLECLRVVGDPQDLATQYYEAGADELLYMDIVASLYGRNNLLNIIEKASQNIFIPLTVGGGIRSIDDIRCVLRAGADKVAINTHATKHPEFITEAARAFGSQCIVASIEAQKTGEHSWEALTDNGRERTGLDAVAWAKKLELLGAGELLITSVDQEGTERGYDVELLAAIAPEVGIPVIASGGAGNPEHIVEVLQKGRADAVSCAHIFHYNKHSIREVKEALHKQGISVRL